VAIGLESLFVLMLADLLFSLFYDTAHNEPLAYPLFYKVVGRAGIEPATNGLKVRCSTG
jgi:hypothetical protein